MAISGKPYLNELGYACIYYYGLEYRVLVEKQDVKEVLFEVIDLVSTFERLSYGYNLIAYLTFLINYFTGDEIDKLLKFYQNNKEHYIYKLMPIEKYNVKFSAFDFYSDNNSV